MSIPIASGPAIDATSADAALRSLPPAMLHVLRSMVKRGAPAYSTGRGGLNWGHELVTALGYGSVGSLGLPTTAVCASTCTPTAVPGGVAVDLAAAAATTAKGYVGVWAPQAFTEALVIGAVVHTANNPVYAGVRSSATGTVVGARVNQTAAAADFGACVDTTCVNESVDVPPRTVVPFVVYIGPYVVWAVRPGGALVGIDHTVAADQLAVAADVLTSASRAIYYITALVI